jgi:hypothetical protein
MESAILRNLQPEFAPVAVIRGNAIPDGALRFKKGKFGCIFQTPSWKALSCKKHH